MCKQARIYNAKWWYAVDHDGTPCLHIGKPEECNGKQYVSKLGSYTLMKDEVPDSLKDITYDDGPVLVRLDLKVVRLSKANV